MNQWPRLWYKLKKLIYIVCSKFIRGEIELQASNTFKSKVEYYAEPLDYTKSLTGHGDFGDKDIVHQAVCVQKNLLLKLEVSLKGNIFLLAWKHGYF